jgi:hypothetical protein
MVRKIFRVNIMVVMFMLLLGCDFLEDSYHQQPQDSQPGLTGNADIFHIIRIVRSGGSRTISRSVTHGADKQVNENIELWLMPTVRGNDEPITHSNVYEMKKFSMLSDGSYEIPLDLYFYNLRTTRICRSAC